MAREVLGVAGAVIGGIYGGGQGAQIGFAIGSTIGGVIDGPEKVKMPGLGEAPVQTSRDGIPIPIVWGLHHMHGNVIIKNPLNTIIVREKQGKGGGTVTESERWTMTYAIGVCRSSIGPINSISRIWQYDKLVYDISFAGVSQAEHNKYAAGIRIYLGDEAQMPDPDLEAFWGVGTTPAHRGLAYVVWVDQDITDFGGTIPQFRFEVNGGIDLSVTSTPYAIEDLGGMIGSVDPRDGHLSINVLEGVAGSLTPKEGFLSGNVVEQIQDPEGIIGNNIFPLEGALSGDVINQIQDEEGIEGEIIPLEGFLSGNLITYSHWPTHFPEGMEGELIPKEGTLTVP